MFCREHWNSPRKSTFRAPVVSGRKSGDLRFEPDVERPSRAPLYSDFHRSRYRISRGCDAMVTHPLASIGPLRSEDGAAMGRQSRYWLWLAFLLKLGFSAAAPA